ncbi:hypothetical protein HYV80_07310 [Candidatus Woesearchaeota archaeon]|nr:hypothetical protein [Candidatus Woesearchaeota archaeon]
MEKPLSFFTMDLVLLFVAIGLIFAVFDLHRFAFVVELLLLLALFSLFIFAMFAIYNDQQWGWTIIAAALAFLMIDMLFIYLITGIFETEHLTVVIFSAIGLAIALLSLKSTKPGKGTERQGSPTRYYQHLDKMEPEKSEESAISGEFTPGRYIASKKAGKYHIAKCDWAKRISLENQLWFGSEDEAKAKGFEADKCVA